MSPHVVNTVICCDQAVAAVAAGGVNGSIGQTVSGGIGGIERAECRSVSRIDPVAAAHIVEHIADLARQCAAVCRHAFRIDRQRLHAVCHIQFRIGIAEDLCVCPGHIAFIIRQMRCFADLAAADHVVIRVQFRRFAAGLDVKTVCSDGICKDIVEERHGTVVRHIQRAERRIGAGVASNGVVDDAVNSGVRCTADRDDVGNLAVVSADRVVLQGDIFVVVSAEVENISVYTVIGDRITADGGGSAVPSPVEHMFGEGVVTDH